MIEPTDEMRAAYLAAWAGNGCSIKAGLAAVLAIVERDHCLERRGHARGPLTKGAPTPRRCEAVHEDGTRCERKPHPTGLHVYADVEAGNLVVW